MIKKAIFWDFDGTLARSPMIWSRSVHRALEMTDPAQTVDFEALRGMMRTGYSWDTPDIPYTDAVGDAWWRTMEARFRLVYETLGVPAGIAGSAAGKVRALILNPGEYSLYEDAVPILGMARARGWRSYILSNNYPELPEIVEALGIAGYFQGMVVSGALGYDKPHPEIFAYAKALAGHPGRCVMVGDNPRADIEGGAAAGMETVLVHREADCAPTWRFRDLIEMRGIL